MPAVKLEKVTAENYKQVGQEIVNEFLKEAQGGKDSGWEVRNACS